MLTFKAFVGMILLISLGVVFLVTRRLMAYNSKYRFPEDKYTKLFHVFKKEHFLVLYFIFAGGQAIFIIWFFIIL